MRLFMPICLLVAKSLKTVKRRDWGWNFFWGGDLGAPPRLRRGGRAIRGFSRLWRPAPLGAAPTIPSAMPRRGRAPHRPSDANPRSGSASPLNKGRSKAKASRPSDANPRSGSASPLNKGRSKAKASRPSDANPRSGSASPLNKGRSKAKASRPSDAKRWAEWPRPSPPKAGAGPSD